MTHSTLRSKSASRKSARNSRNTRATDFYIFSAASARIGTRFTACATANPGPVLLARVREENFPRPPRRSEICRTKTGTQEMRHGMARV